MKAEVDRGKEEERGREGKGRSGARLGERVVNNTIKLNDCLMSISIKFE